MALEVNVAHHPNSGTNRYPVDVLWKALQYKTSMDKLTPYADRPDLDPHFLIWDLGSPKADAKGQSGEAKEHPVLPTIWFPQSPNCLYRYAAVLKANGQISAAREVVKRYCWTDFWGDGGIRRDPNLAGLLENPIIERPLIEPVKEIAAPEMPPEGITRLMLEVSPPMPGYGEKERKHLPVITETLEWNGSSFTSSDCQVSCPPDVASFLVEQASKASEARFLPSPSQPYQVRLTIERAGKTPIHYWSELGINRWMFPLFIAFDGSFRFLDDPEAQWAALSIFHRNSFLKSIDPEFHLSDQPGIDLSAGFIASAGINERFPEPPFAANSLQPNEKIKASRRSACWPSGLENPVIIEANSLKQEGKWNDPSSSFFFYRQVMGSDSYALPSLGEIRSVRSKIQGQMMELCGRLPHSMNVRPNVDYDMGDTFDPEQRQLIGFDVVAGIPSGYNAHTFIRLLRSLDLTIPATGPFPIPWRFSADYRKPDVRFSGYWLDFAGIMVITDLKARWEGGEADSLTAQLRPIFRASSSNAGPSGTVELIDGLGRSRHCFHLKEKNQDFRHELTKDMFRKGWTISPTGSAVTDLLILNPPEGTIFFFQKRAGEAARLRTSISGPEQL